MPSEVDDDYKSSSEDNSLITKQRHRVTVWPHSSSCESDKSDSGITNGDKEGDCEELLAEMMPRPKPLSDTVIGKDLSMHPLKINPQWPISIRFLQCSF